MDPELPVVALAPEPLQVEETPPARRRVVFVIVSLALFMGSLDQTIVATALPVLQHDLGARIDWGGWTITVYALGQVITMPIAGKASDQFGRRRIFLGAVVLFTTASLLCGMSTNIYELIGLRAVQAIGGGAFMPSATGIVTDLFGQERDRALAMFSTIFPMGGVIGPVLGGVFTDYWSWRGIFLINVPIGIVLVIVGVAVIPRNTRTRSERFDIVGVVLLCTTLLAAMFGMTYLGRPHRSPLSPWFVVAMAVAVIGGTAFVRHSRTAAAPVITFRHLAGPGFRVVNVVNLVFGAGAMGFSALIPIYAQTRLHITPLSSSTMLIARSVGIVLASIVAAHLLRRTGVRRPMMVGAVLLIAGLLISRIVASPLSPYTWIAVGATVMGLGVGSLSPAANNAVLQLEPDHAAAISGIRGMIRQMGGITAITVATAIAARSGHPADALSWSFVGFAAMVLLVLPLIRRVPEHRGAW